MSEAASRGRPRRAEIDDTLMRATIGLLREKGPRGVTIEAVGVRSGVARTTIYRRFTSRRQLISAALNPVVERTLPPADLSTPARVRWVFDQVVDLFHSRLGPGVVAAIIGDVDPEFTGALRSALEVQLSALATQVRSDVDSGRVAAHVDPDALVGLLLGSYLSEVLRHGNPRTRWVDSTVDLVARAIEPAASAL